MALTILHMDMDAFYASIEIRERPELAELPIVIGSPSDQRGVVSTCNYVARKYGIHSAMPSRTAYQRCPKAVFLPVRMELYQEVSRKVMEIVYSFTPVIEPLSVDEAFVDVEGVLHLWDDVISLAQAIKDKISEETQLTASIGVAPNKFLAKLASDMDKPDGLTVMPDGPDEIIRYLAPLPVSKIFGVGKKTLWRLHENGVRTMAHVQSLSEASLKSILGSEAGACHVWALAHGRDTRTVNMEQGEKSVSNEHTFSEDTSDRDEQQRTMIQLAENVACRMRVKGRYACTAQIKIRVEDFHTITRQMPFPSPSHSDREYIEAALTLFEREAVTRPVRLIGFGVSNLVDDPLEAAVQPMLFEEMENVVRDHRNEALDEAVDQLKNQYGKGIIGRGGRSGC